MEIQLETYDDSCKAARTRMISNNLNEKLGRFLRHSSGIYRAL